MPALCAPEITETHRGSEPTLRMFRVGPDISEFDLVVPSNCRHRELSDVYSNMMQSVFAGAETEIRYLDEVTKAM